MIISGSGIATPLRVWIKPDFTPKTTLSLNWSQLSNGQWVATDRGASSDQYKTTVSIQGRQETINALLVAIYSNRTASSGTPNVLTLTDFAENEKIFGLDVVHTTDNTNGINVTVTELRDSSQKSLNSWELTFLLQAINPTFNGSASATISFDHIEQGYSNNSTWNINKYDTYNSTFTHLDHKDDTGIIEFVAQIKNADHVTLRRSLATSRSAPITTTVLKGVTFPFGPNNTLSWPMDLTYISVEEQGNWGMNYQRIKVKAVQYDF